MLYVVDVDIIFKATKIFVTTPMHMRLVYKYVAVTLLMDYTLYFYQEAATKRHFLRLVELSEKLKRQD